jgi:hypothetical protein
MRIQAFFVRHSKDPYNLFLRLLGPRNERFFLCPPWEKVESPSGSEITYNNSLNRTR